MDKSSVRDAEMNPIVLGGIIDSVGKVIDNIWTSDKEKLELALKEKEIDASIAQSQMAVNQQEAAHANLFVAGWRPAIGWIGATVIAYQFLFYPLMTWIWVFGQGNNWIPQTLNPPPMIKADELWVIITGMLGIAGLRSWDKKNGVSR